MTRVTEQQSLTVAVPTFCRPAELDALLPLVASAAREVGMDVRLLVVDNDPAGSAEPVVAAHPEFRYVQEAAPGIAAVRQRILDETRSSDLVVMLDDDLVPQPGWLPALVEGWRATRAAAVVGHVAYTFDPEVDPLVVAGRFFHRDRLRSGARLPTTAAGNLLLDRRQLDALGVGFDRRLGLSGGEDTLFGYVLVAAGGDVVFCGESEVVGRLPLERTGRTEAILRARGHGGIEVRVGLALADGPMQRLAVRLRAAVGGPARVLVGCALVLVGILTRSVVRRARGLRLVARGQGMLLASAGRYVVEYDREPRPARSGGPP